MAEAINWICKPFAELENTELYAIMQARVAVFIVEQNCLYQDLSGGDAMCWHLYATRAGEIKASARLVPPGLHYPEASIGRVLSTQSGRSVGLGRELMTRAIAECERIFGAGPIKIGAQMYLEQFYQGFGFVRVSEPYDEDGIPHIKMRRA
jgi:ElaA protein